MFGLEEKSIRVFKNNLSFIFTYDYFLCQDMVICSTLSIDLTVFCCGLCFTIFLCTLSQLIFLSDLLFQSKQSHLSCLSSNARAVFTSLASSKVKRFSSLYCGLLKKGSSVEAGWDFLKCMCSKSRHLTLWVYQAFQPFFILTTKLFIHQASLLWIPLQLNHIFKRDFYTPRQRFLPTLEVLKFKHQKRRHLKKNIYFSLFIFIYILTLFLGDRKENLVTLH